MEKICGDYKNIISQKMSSVLQQCFSLVTCLYDLHDIFGMQARRVEAKVDRVEADTDGGGAGVSGGGGSGGGEEEEEAVQEIIFLRRDR
jgi:hypothetical protein